MGDLRQDGAARGGGVRRRGDWPADDEIIGAGVERLARRHDALLIVLPRRIGGTDAGHDEKETLPAVAAQGGDLVRRADDAVERGLPGEGGEATRLVERRTVLADAGKIGIAEARPHADAHELYSPPVAPF